MTPVSRKDLIEIAGLRILLECHALTASIQNGDIEWEGDLVAAHHKLQRVEDRMLGGDLSDKETWKRYDWQFHKALIRACNSKNLLALHATIYDKYLRYQMLVLTYRGEQAVLEHEGIFDAALARDAAGATKLLKDHIHLGTGPGLPDF